MKHHAYYIEGALSLFEPYKELLKPFWAKNFERFGIDEARALTELAGLKNIGGATFFVATASLTTEAQQALLKLFEEPQAGTTFVLLVPHGSIIATLRSRMLAYPEVLEAEVRSSGARKFLKSGQKERSAEVAKLLKDEEGVRERAREFVNALEQELYPSISKKEVREGLTDIARVRGYLGDRSPSLKMLLEHLAIVLPRIEN